MSFSLGDSITESGAIGNYCKEEGLSEVDKAGLRFIHMRSRALRKTKIEDIFNFDSAYAFDIAQCYPECGKAITEMQKNPDYKQKMYDFYMRTIRPMLADDVRN